jgi:NAD+ synthase (glutamine-hydrolysing)
MRLALAQINTVVGDLDGNVARIVGRLREARNAGADLVLFPELAITGYPPEDLLFRPGFLREARRAVEQVAAETTDIAALVGVPWLDRDLYNGCAICAGGDSCPTTGSSTRSATSSRAGSCFSFRWARL